jgi:hypothetical protein
MKFNISVQHFSEIGIQMQIHDRFIIFWTQQYLDGIDEMGSSWEIRIFGYTFWRILVYFRVPQLRSETSTLNIMKITYNIPSIFSPIFISPQNSQHLTHCYFTHVHPSIKPSTSYLSILVTVNNAQHCWVCCYSCYRQCSHINSPVIIFGSTFLNLTIFPGMFFFNVDLTIFSGMLSPINLLYL